MGLGATDDRDLGKHAMNHSIVTADRSTHLKIVVVALVAAIAVVSVGIAARVNTLDLGTDIVARRADQPRIGVVKVTKPVTWTSSDGVTVR
jgi:hypothetical protein